MAKLTIVLDVDDVDPTLEDPHTLADDLLNRDLDTFEPGAPFSIPFTKLKGRFVTAEWTQ